MYLPGKDHTLRRELLQVPFMAVAQGYRLARYTFRSSCHPVQQHISELTKRSTCAACRACAIRKGVFVKTHSCHTGARAQDFLGVNQVIELGVAPNRIDIVTAPTGVRFDEAWTDKVEAELDGIPIHMLSRKHLIKNKKALRHPKDVADLDFLEEP